MAEPAPRTRPAQIVIGFLLSIGVAELPLGTWSERLFGPLAGHEVLWGLAVVVLLLYVALIERRPLSSIGFRKFGFWGIVSAIVAGVLMVVAVVVIYTYVFPALHLRINIGEMNKLIATPFWYRLLLVTRAAVAEETLFRGYPIERIEELTRSRALAGLISWAAFTIAHLSSWGWAQLIVAGTGGVILTVLYLWRRNLWVNMIAHFIADGSGFLMPH